MPREEMLDRISSKEFTRWQAYFLLQGRKFEEKQQRQELKNQADAGLAEIKANRYKNKK